VDLAEDRDDGAAFPSAPASGESLGAFAWIPIGATEGVDVPSDVHAGRANPAIAKRATGAKRGRASKLLKRKIKAQILK
jgi:hypothetical protein